MTFLVGTASAEPRDDMAVALTAQVDAQPTRATRPFRPRQALATAQTAAGSLQTHAQSQANAARAQAEATATSAASQARENAAKAQHAHPPHPVHMAH